MWGDDAGRNVCSGAFRRKSFKMYDCLDFKNYRFILTRQRLKATPGGRNYERFHPTLINTSGYTTLTLPSSTASYRQRRIAAVSSS